MDKRDDLLPAAERLIRAAGRYVAEGDPYALAELAQLAPSIESALGTAVDGLRSHGYTDQELADALGVTRLTVRNRFPPTSPRPTGAAAWRRRSG